MIKKAISTNNAPGAIGPYSQAIEMGGFIFVSGQIPVDPKTGSITGSEIKEQTHRVIQNIDAVLKEAGCTLDNVVKTTCYLSSMDNFTEMNNIYAKYFVDIPPARATIEVSRLPKSVLIEIDAIAIK